MVATSYAHIVLDDAGRAWIEGTGVKVLEIIWERQTTGRTPEEFCRQYPHLTPADIHAALTYYYDYQAEIDDQIRQEQALVEASLAASPGPDPALRRRIQEARKAQ